MVCLWQCFHYFLRICGRRSSVPESHSNIRVLTNKQFGVTLESIIERYQVSIPPVVKQCIDYLDQRPALETQGIFRISSNAAKLLALKGIANNGGEVTFENVHEAAALLKEFLRELREPLLTFEMYKSIKKFQDWNQKLRTTSLLVNKKLPQSNYAVLKYIVRFLSKVMEHSDKNKMDAYNLSVVFGPNFLWPKSKPMSLDDLKSINMFTQFLLEHQHKIFNR